MDIRRSEAAGPIPPPPESPQAPGVGGKERKPEGIFPYPLFRKAGRRVLLSILSISWLLMCDNPERCRFSTCEPHFGCSPALGPRKLHPNALAFGRVLDYAYKRGAYIETPS